MRSIELLSRRILLLSKIDNNEPDGDNFVSHPAFSSIKYYQPCFFLYLLVPDRDTSQYNTIGMGRENLF